MKDSKYHYQIVAVLNPKTEDKEKETVLNKISAWVEGAEAEVVKKDHMGAKDLVYPIKKLNKGDFYVFEIDSNKTFQLKEFNLFLNREPTIIRYLILQK
ncbi:MAG TPA: 30S ribosomal protein S6 [Patescibacteria group bacterium]